MPHDHHAASANNRFGTVSRWVFWGFVAIALYFLITEHRAHVIPFLPFLLLAACPLMHLFHHSGHAHGDERDDDEDRRPDAEPRSGSDRNAHQH